MLLMCHSYTHYGLTYIKLTQPGTLTLEENHAYFKGILCDENHLYGILLVHLTSNKALKARKCRI